ncbi:uncharacterized protein I206_105827 [Kwoniella pini CBS 10737]|uniref:Uncharacterized protein n=1 Tax=Kwoniella pini CBS 10737 TaxID=1296096 RepID=A0A1B9I098_9TREE|nr:uncharacterized protein I206_04647 [Kwoniella pini CBS 10737]OCF48960.1 hypothetical protein I206_04647 [Kwoniella pini CBS 10737]
MPTIDDDDNPKTSGTKDFTSSTTKDKNIGSATSNDYTSVSNVASTGQNYFSSLSPTVFVVLMIIAIIGAIAIVFWIYWFCLSKKSRERRKELRCFRRKRDLEKDGKKESEAA